MVKGLEITDSNYTVALSILKYRYDNPTKRTHAILRKFYNLPAPKHNAKELRNFLDQYRQVREQMKLITNINAAELVVKTTLMKKFTHQTYEEISDFCKNFDFSLEEMSVALQFIIDKFEHSQAARGDQTNVKSVEAKSQNQKQKDHSSPSCAYCSGAHKAAECTKYKALNAHRDRVIAQKLCFNCLRAGHASKVCKSPRSCQICHP